MGEGRQRVYNIWSSMKSRTTNPNNPGYKYYGERGISVCDEWRSSFQAFYEWSMTHGYADNLTIDRIDNNGNYEPSNCRWVDMKTQSRNKSSNRLITCNGETKALCDWCETANIHHSIITSRMQKGLTVEQALAIPSREKQNQQKVYKIKQCLQENPQLSIRKISQQTGISKSAVQRFLSKEKQTG